MKISKLLTITALATLGVAALGSAAISKTTFKRAQAADQYLSSIGEDEYEGALLSAYVDKNEGDSIYKDKPLGSSMLSTVIVDGGAGARGRDKEYKARGVNDTATWKFSGVKGYQSSTIVHTILTPGYSNIGSADDYADATSDERQIGALLLEGLDPGAQPHSASMISVQEFKLIKDISFYWSTCDAWMTGVYYKLNGDSEWKELTHSNSSGNYTGSRSWDEHGLTTFNLSGWTEHELYGKTAKVAFATAGGSAEADTRLSAVMINHEKAAIKYLNHISYREGVCKGGALDLTLDSSSYRHNYDYWQFMSERLTVDDGAYFDQFICTSTKTSEESFLDFYNYLNSLGLNGPVISSSNSIFSRIAATNKDNGYMIAIIAITSMVALSSIALFVLRKKHQ